MLAKKSKTAAQVRLSDASLRFDFQSGGVRPAPQRIRVRTAVESEVNFRATATVTKPPNGRWLSVTPTLAGTPSEIEVSANPAGLDPGDYDGEIVPTLEVCVNRGR